MPDNVLSRLLRETVVCVLVLTAAVPVAPQQRKTVAGVVSITAGLGLVIEAYDLAATCPEGYHPATPRNADEWGQGGVHQCVHGRDGSGGFNIVDATYETGITRPRLAWAGLGAIGFGVVALLLPGNRATRGLDVQVSAESVTLRRKFGW